jgi:hypothetical protein
LPYLTASVLKIKLPKAMAAIKPPFTPEMKGVRPTLNSSAKGTNAGARRGPMAIWESAGVDAGCGRMFHVPPTQPQP